MTESDMSTFRTTLRSQAIVQTTRSATTGSVGAAPPTQPRTTLNQNEVAVTAMFDTSALAGSNPATSFVKENTGAILLPELCAAFRQKMPAMRRLDQGLHERFEPSATPATWLRLAPPIGRADKVRYRMWSGKRPNSRSRTEPKAP